MKYHRFAESVETPQQAVAIAVACIVGAATVILMLEAFKWCGTPWGLRLAISPFIGLGLAVPITHAAWKLSH